MNGGDSTKLGNGQRARPVRGASIYDVRSDEMH